MLDSMGSRAPCSSMVSESMLLEQVESHAALWAHLWLEASSQQAVSDAWVASALLDQLCQVAKVNSCLTAGPGLRVPRQHRQNLAKRSLLQAGWDMPPGPLGWWKLCQSAWGQERLGVLQHPLGKHACPRVLPEDGRRCSQCCGIRSSASCFGISVYPRPHTLTLAPRPCHSLSFQGVVRQRTNTMHAMLEAFGEKNSQW